MLFGHDEGKNLKQLCNGLKDVICIAMGGTGADNPKDARKNLGLGAAAEEDIVPITKGGTGKTTKAEALEALGGISKALVWENTSPTSEFKKQDISINASEGDEIEIEYRPYNGSTATKRERCEVGGTMVLDLIASNNAFSTGSIIMAGFRRVSTTETTVAVNTGYAYNGEDNRFCVPVRIYIKKGVQ